MEGSTAICRIRGTAWQKVGRGVEAWRRAYLLQLNLSPPPIIRIRLQTRGEQAPDGGGVHGGQRGWKFGRGSEEAQFRRGGADGRASSGRGLEGCRGGPVRWAARRPDEVPGRWWQRIRGLVTMKRMNEGEEEEEKDDEPGRDAVLGKPESRQRETQWVKLLGTFFPRFRVVRIGGACFSPRHWLT